MITLLAALALTQAGPANLKLDFEKATPMVTINAFEKLSHWEARGLVIADDGSRIFGAQSFLMQIPTGSAFPMSDRFYLPSWKKSSPPFTSDQITAFLKATKGFDPKKTPFVSAEVMDVASAASRSEIVIRHLYAGADIHGITRMALESPMSSDNKVLCGPEKGEEPGRPIADVSSNTLLVPYYKEVEGHPKFSALRYVNGPKKPAIPYREGYVPFVFDSARDIVLGFTYSEHGGQDMLMIHKIGTKEDIQIPRAQGEIGVSALLPDGRILTTYRLAPYDEQKAGMGRYGIYECAPPYKTLTFLGPYQIEGSSRNGKYLLVSSLMDKGTWVLALR